MFWYWDRLTVHDDRSSRADRFRFEVVRRVHVRFTHKHLAVRRDVRREWRVRRSDVVKEVDGAVLRALDFIALNLYIYNGRKIKKIYGIFKLPTVICFPGVI